MLKSVSLTSLWVKTIHWLYPVRALSTHVVLIILVKSVKVTEKTCLHFKKLNRLEELFEYLPEVIHRGPSKIWEHFARSTNNILRSTK